MERFLWHSPLLFSLLSPTEIFTLLTSPSLPLTISTTLASLHSPLGNSTSMSITMSPTHRFLFGASQSCLAMMLRRYSRFHRLQNCSARYCTRRHLFTPYKSSLMTCLALSCSLTVEGVHDLIFLVRRRRRATALVAWDHEENFDRRSARLNNSVVFVCRVCALLTSGSPMGNSSTTSLGVGISFSQRNVGPVNQLEASNSFTVFPLDAPSAGFSFVGT